MEVGGKMTVNDREFGQLQGTMERLTSSVDILSENISLLHECFNKHCAEAAAREQKINSNWFHIKSLWGVIVAVASLMIGTIWKHMMGGK